MTKCKKCAKDCPFEYNGQCYHDPYDYDGDYGAKVVDELKAKEQKKAPNK